MRAILLIVLSMGSSCQSQQINDTELTAVAFDSKINSASIAFILDVRTPGEFAEGYIGDAINMIIEMKISKRI